MVKEKERMEVLGYSVPQKMPKGLQRALEQNCSQNIPVSPRTRLYLYLSTMSSMSWSHCKLCDLSVHMLIDFIRPNIRNIISSHHQWEFHILNSHQSDLEQVTLLFIKSNTNIYSAELLIIYWTCVYKAGKNYSIEVVVFITVLVTLVIMVNAWNIRCLIELEILEYY